ncbi:MAG: carbamoyl-phosphate synthase large subunit, partial [Clostridia bacterium]|nr:carbamoyl-phosphate synthase large subunit [Clostridia bacterium]
GGVADTPDELRTIVRVGLDQSPIRQVLIECYIYGWKEIEFEVIRDGDGNKLAVCSMENVDPVGVHTGDSIVVAPAQTLAVPEFSMLRTAALDIIEALGIEGGCNCQFALDPASDRYAVIEVNPRVSRSSALASKATGYPIAKVTTRIALGYRLDEIKNEITGKTTAAFEPTVDYVVLKMPKFPFDKFGGTDRRLGTQMKATGEVMSIAPSFEAALMKAIRGAEISLDTLNAPAELLGGAPTDIPDHADDLRLFKIFRALRAGVPIDDIFAVTRIDRFFLAKLKKLADFEDAIAGRPLSDEEYLRAKRLGYPDRALARITGHELPPHRPAVYKLVDTCAAEYSAERPYFYSTCDDAAHNEVTPFLRPDRETVVVLGSGPIRIGQGIEFDYSSVHCAWALKRLGYDVVIINNNPETVSTDFDIADRLYFEPLTPEDVDDVLAIERPIGVVVAFGGQTAIKLTAHLDRCGVKVLGTSADGIDMAEDRARFEALLEECGICRPAGCGVMTTEEALDAAHRLGYPVLVRPSYVIGGQNMVIAASDEDIVRYMAIIEAQGIDDPVLVDKYLHGTELEVDVISDGTDVLIPGIMEHIERTGVHSGDSIAVYPPYSITDTMREKIVDCSTKLALRLGTRGLVNIQYLIYENELYVIEVNPRASRTIPYISKVTGVPMVDLATKIMVGGSLREQGYGSGLWKNSPYVAVKVPVFSFAKLGHVNPMLSPEMKSTGEVLGLGKTLEEALFKGLVSAGFALHNPHDRGLGVYISVHDRDKPDVLELARKFNALGMAIYATPGTARYIEQLGCDITVVDNPSGENNIFPYLENGSVSYIVNTCPNLRNKVEEHISLSRRAMQLGIVCMSSLDTARAVADILASRWSQQNTELVDLNHMRTERQRLRFAKMQTLGNNYIYLDNTDGAIWGPESLAVDLCDRHFAIGGDGIVLIERSTVADARMRIFNRDGSEGGTAGNALRCVAKYLYDRGMVRRLRITVEAADRVYDLRLILTEGKVSAVEVDMGSYSLAPDRVPTTLSPDENGAVIGRPVTLADRKWTLTCVSMGNPHAVVFVDRVDALNLAEIGPQFEYAPIFPARINTEFVRIVNRTTLKMRVWERGNGETLACGTGACAAVVAAIAAGECDVDRDITVKLQGGDLTVRVTSAGRVLLTGNAVLAFEGETVL